MLWVGWYALECGGERLFASSGNMSNMKLVVLLLWHVRGFERIIFYHSHTKTRFLDMLLQSVHAALGVSVSAKEESASATEIRKTPAPVVFLPRCTLLPSISRHPVIAIYHLAPTRVYDVIVRILSALEEADDQSHQREIDFSEKTVALTEECPQNNNKRRRTSLKALPSSKTCCEAPCLLVDERTGDIVCHNCGAVAAQGVSGISYEDEQQLLQETSQLSMDMLREQAGLSATHRTYCALKSLREHVEHICANPLMGRQTPAEDVIRLLITLRRHEQKTSPGALFSFSALEIVACVLVTQHKHDLLKYHDIFAQKAIKQTFGQCRRCADIFYRKIDRRMHRCEPRVRQRLAFQAGFAPLWNTRMFITVAEARLDSSRPVPPVRYAFEKR
eukprot:6213232-Pleurochrysis_carterae.AAC.1